MSGPISFQVKCIFLKENLPTVGYMRWRQANSTAATMEFIILRWLSTTIQREIHHDGGRDTMQLQPHVAFWIKETKQNCLFYCLTIKSSADRSKCAHLRVVERHPGKRRKAGTVDEAGWGRACAQKGPTVPIRADGWLPHRHMQAKEHEHESVQQMEYWITEWMIGKIREEGKEEQGRDEEREPRHGKPHAKPINTVFTGFMSRFQAWAEYVISWRHLQLRGLSLIPPTDSFEDFWKRFDINQNTLHWSSLRLWADAMGWHRHDDSKLILAIALKGTHPHVCLLKGKRKHSRSEKFIVL